MRFFRDLRFELVHQLDPDDGARARLELGTARIHMPPWALFNSARDYYATLAHESVHWVKYVREQFDEAAINDAIVHDREDLIAEVGAAFLCADLGVSNVPLANQVSYVNGMRKTLRDPRLAVLEVADEAAATVGWLHQLAPGHRIAEGVVFRRALPVPASGQARLYDMVSAARQFVADTQKLRGSTSRRSSTWITEAVRLLDEANHIDLEVEDVRVAIAAAVFLAGGGQRGAMAAGDYIEEVRRELGRDVEQARMDLHRSSGERPRAPGMRL